MDRTITWGPDGPTGIDEMRFAELGLRLALIEEDGSLSDYGHYELKSLGGEVPHVGDQFAMLWPEGDPDSEEVFEVVRRAYVGEFAGDYCWWLVIREVAPEKADEELFALHRASSEFHRDLMQKHLDQTRAKLAMKELKKAPK